MEEQTDFYLKQLAQLLGGKITGLARTGVDDEGQEFFGIVVTLPNGKIKNLIIMSDDDGNAPGSFEIS